MEKKKEKKMRPPELPQIRLPATPETEFFLEWPHYTDTSQLTHETSTLKMQKVMREGVHIYKYK